MWWSHPPQEENANQLWIPAPNIQEGSKVFLDGWHVWMMRSLRNLNLTQLRPYMVIGQISPLLWEFDISAAVQINWVQPLLLWDHVADDPLNTKWVDLPPTVVVDGKAQYQVLSNDDSGVYWNWLQYVMRWTGYDLFPCEPAKFIDGLHGVGNVHQRDPEKPRLFEQVFQPPQTKWGDTVSAHLGVW